MNLIHDELALIGVRSCLARARFLRITYKNVSLDLIEV
jgi:hypothetical protein